MQIGTIIREIREAQKATLEEIALAAGTNPSNLSRIERGVQGYSADTLAKIANALGVTVSQLHQRAESTELDPATEIHRISHRLAALTPENRELVDDFITLLLRRQGT
ncbi:helix-turn-helix transcriptional regulator [Magnetovirga frankeli]|uniref:helix-turn-helix domain-containing protein n=1 Tax=Magnetovirga frankeli TaxID=947516 RepID=UPI001AFA1AAA|nr:helix-turn-helix transcriptional regulator [gamma proteobacterium SS-5]